MSAIHHRLLDLALGPYVAFGAHDCRSLRSGTSTGNAYADRSAHGADPDALLNMRFGQGT